MAAKVIVLSIDCNEQEGEQIKKSLNILVKYAKADELMKLAQAVQNNPKIISKALKFI